MCTHRTHPTAHGPEIRVETAGQTDTTDRITFPANSQWMKKTDYEYRLRFPCTPHRGTRGTRPHQCLKLAVVFSWALWEAYSVSPDLLAEFKGRSKQKYGRSWMRHGWAITRDVEGTEEKKERDRLSLTWCSLQLSSRGCAHGIQGKVNPYSITRVRSRLGAAA